MIDALIDLGKLCAACRIVVQAGRAIQEAAVEEQGQAQAAAGAGLGSTVLKPCEAPAPAVAARHMPCNAINKTFGRCNMPGGIAQVLLDLGGEKEAIGRKRKSRLQATLGS